MLFGEATLKALLVAFRRQKNVLSESRKNKYNVYIVQ